MDEGGRIERQAAVLRLAAQDREGFLELLAGRLGVLLPGLVDVERGGLPLARRRPVRRLVVRLPEERLVLEPSGAGLAGEAHVVVHEIVVRRDRLALDAWVGRLADAIDAHAADAAPGAGLARLLALE